jgi:hypothetical protein
VEREKLVTTLWSTVAAMRRRPVAAQNQNNIKQIEAALIVSP